MRVGILTFHYAHNYGAVLQAYALKKVLTEMGHETSFVNYKNCAIASLYTREICTRIGIKDIIKFPSAVNKYRYYKLIKPGQRQWETRYDKFEYFINCFLIGTHDEEWSTDNCDRRYDALIVGSDQVWSSAIIGRLDKVYLLDFPYRGRKIAYAPSIYEGVIPKDEIDIFKRVLKDFDDISVREESLALSIEENFGIQARNVLDPTLLLSSYDYDTIVVDVQNDKPYVLAYFVNEDEEFSKIAKIVAKQYHLSLIELHCYMLEDYDPAYQHADFGPEEFLGAIKNAELVLSNSFHGTVFSILYERKFYSICKHNARIKNLLQALELEDRQVYESNMVKADKEIDYSRVKVLLDKYRKTSFSFLENALNDYKGRY